MEINPGPLVVTEARYRCRRCRQFAPRCSCRLGPDYVSVDPKVRAVDIYRAARADFLIATTRADLAFMRWFEKAQRGARTNAAAATRLANQASYASADLHAAEGKLYALEIDPRDIDREDGVEVQPG